MTDSQTPYTPETRVFAVADEVPGGRHPYLTAGKRYEVQPHSDRYFFWAIGDDGIPFGAHWSDSSHLDGGNWRRVEVPAEPAPVEAEKGVDTGGWLSGDSVHLLDAAATIQSLRAENEALRAERDALREACVQARGALRLDAIVDASGRPFGTTLEALSAIDAALGEGRP